MITVKILATGETVSVEESWGLRLIEQGRAVPEAGKRKKAKDGTDGQDRS